MEFHASKIHNTITNCTLNEQMNNWMNEWHYYSITTMCASSFLQCHVYFIHRQTKFLWILLCSLPSEWNKWKKHSRKMSTSGSIICLVLCAFRFIPFHFFFRFCAIEIDSYAQKCKIFRNAQTFLHFWSNQLLIHIEHMMDTRAEIKFSQANWKCHILKQHDRNYLTSMLVCVHFAVSNFLCFENLKLSYNNLCN